MGVGAAAAGASLGLGLSAIRPASTLRSGTNRPNGGDRVSAGGRRRQLCPGGELSQIIGGGGAGPDEELAVLMGRCVGLAIGERHAQRLKLLAERPSQITGHIADFGDHPVHRIRESGNPVDKIR